MRAMSASRLENSTMPLEPQEDFGVPDETRRVALAAFPKGCACLRIADALGGVYLDNVRNPAEPNRSLSGSLVSSSVDLATLEVETHAQGNALEQFRPTH